MLSAIVFDFDGVIVDSEPLHFEAFIETLRPEGIDFTWPEYVEHYIGFDDRGVFQAAFKASGKPLAPEQLRELGRAKEAAFSRLVQAGRAHPYPGTVELIKSLHGKIPLALCSGALRTDIQPVLEQLGLQSAFEVMVTADDVPVSKPDPASYQLVHQRLQEHFPQVEGPERCIAIEDTADGIRSAKATGFRVLALTHSHEAQALKEADWIVESLELIDLMHFQRIIQHD